MVAGSYEGSLGSPRISDDVSHLREHDAFHVHGAVNRPAYVACGVRSVVRHQSCDGPSGVCGHLLLAADELG